METEQKQKQTTIDLDTFVKERPVGSIRTERIKALYLFAQDVPTRYGNPLLELVNALVSDIMEDASAS